MSSLLIGANVTDEKAPDISLLVDAVGHATENLAFRNADELVAAIVKQVGSAVPGSNRRVDPYARNAGCHLLQVTDAIPWDSFLYVLFMRADSTHLALLNAVFPEFLAETPEAWKQD